MDEEGKNDDILWNPNIGENCSSTAPWPGNYNTLAVLNTTVVWKEQSWRLWFLKGGSGAEHCRCGHMTVKIQLATSWVFWGGHKSHNRVTFSKGPATWRTSWSSFCLYLSLSQCVEATQYCICGINMLNAIAFICGINMLNAILHMWQKYAERSLAYVAYKYAQLNLAYMA